MTKNITKLFYGAIFSTLFILAACTGTGTGQIGPGDEPDPTGGATVGLANPSAVYCEGLGYSMENVTREGGQDADCLFPDGSRCAAWDFLAGRCGTEFSFCEGQGFTIVAVNNIATCRFPDGSTCDEFAYFSGECSPEENPQGSEAPVQITDSAAARDFIAAYLADR